MSEVMKKLWYRFQLWRLMRARAKLFKQLKQMGVIGENDGPVQVKA